MKQLSQAKDTLFELTNHIMSENWILYISDYSPSSYDYFYFIGAMLVITAIILLYISKKYKHIQYQYEYNKKRNRYIYITVGAMLVVSIVLISKVMVPLRENASVEYKKAITAKLDNLKNSNDINDNISYLAMLEYIKNIEANSDDKMQGLVYYLYKKKQTEFYSDFFALEYIKKQYKKVKSLEYFKYLLENKIVISDSADEYFIHVNVAKEICNKDLKSKFYFGIRTCNLDNILQNKWILDIDNQKKNKGFYVIKFQNNLKYKIANALDSCDGYSYLKSELINIDKKELPNAKKVLKDIQLKHKCN